MMLMLALLITVPDPKLTPGAMQMQVTRKEVCSPGHSSTERSRLKDSTKESVWRAYGVPSADRSRYRLDHLFPIEAGGCATCATNLWPEPVADSKRKDLLEGRLHRDLCAGRITLDDVPALIRKGWR